MKYIIAPKDSPNDETLTIVECIIENNKWVKKGEDCLSVEGSKAIFSVSASVSGLLYWLVKVGDVVPVGDVIGILYQEGEQQALDDYLLEREKVQKAEPIIPANFTIPAFNLLKKLNLTTTSFEHFELVTTTDVLEQKNKGLLTDLEKHAEALLTVNGNERTLLIGAGKAASQVLSVIGKESTTQVIGFLDDTPEKQGTQHLGYPVLGAISEIAEVIKLHRIDSILCCAGNMQLRIKTLELALQYKLKLANAIHSSVVMDDNVCIAGGNYIGPQSFIGAQAQIGFGCFISSSAIIEHHNKVGHCVTTGPANAFSGSVSIENFCVLGSGIIIEPMVTIGQYSAIASGCVISKTVPAHSALKKSINYMQR